MVMHAPAVRLRMIEQAPGPYAAMRRLDGAIELDPELRELIKIRASQLNGCAFCIDMHWKDARAAGESEERLYLLDAWRESPVYTDRERAALELCEAVTLVADGHVPDEVWEHAAEFFPEEELAQLVFAVVAINAWNRIAISSRMPPGSRPGSAVATGNGARG